MSNAPSSPARRAVVLGGGGVAGIAWHLGMLAEFLEQGVELGAADLVVGTSAGSVAASVLRFDQVPTAYETQVAPEVEAPAAPTAPGAAADATEMPPVDMATFRDRLAEAVTGATSEQDARARLGRAAVAYSGDSGESFLVPTMEAQFPLEAGWPAEPLGICVVEADSGEFRVLDASSGVQLSRAIAASCSVPLVFPPLAIDGALYIDGGARSATNADVAAGYDRVLVLACGPEDPASPMGPQLDAAVAKLRESAEVLVLSADDASLAAFGGNSLAASTRIPSAEAGRAQAARALDEVRAFWS